MNNSFGRQVLIRLGRSAITIWFVVTVVFISLRLSGDPIRLMLPETAPEEQVQAVRHAFGFDEPLPVQYLKYWKQLAVGDFGDSLVYRRPAMGVVVERFPATLRMAFAGFLFSIVLGLGFGFLSARIHGSKVDRLMMAIMSLLQSMPSFLIAIILIMVFSVHLHWVPASGSEGWVRLILPASTIGLLSMASLCRLVRASLLDVSRAEFVRTARAKGLSENAVWLKHIFKNAALPILTVYGLEFAGLLTGAVIVETIFAWPGVGRLAIDSITSRDYPVVQSTVLWIAGMYIVVNLCIDLSYSFIDPRIRRG